MENNGKPIMKNKTTGYKETETSSFCLMQTWQEAMSIYIICHRFIFSHIINYLLTSFVRSVLVKYRTSVLCTDLGSLHPLDSYIRFVKTSVRYFTSIGHARSLSSNEYLQRKLSLSIQTVLTSLTVFK